MEENIVIQTPPAYQQPQAVQQNVYVAQEKRSNGIGTAGFVLALIAFFLCWVPVLDWILWALGAIFSFIGVFRRPRGLAIAGLVISFIGVIIIIAVLGTLMAAFATM